MAQQEEPEFLLAAMGLEVDHLQASLEQARKLGAKTLVPPMTIPNGTVRVVQNPQGHAAGSGNQPATKLAEIIVWRQLL